MGQALMSGVRLKEMMSLLSRAFAVSNVPKEIVADIGRVMERLGPINTTRNNILHWGTQFADSGDEHRVDNRHIAHIQERVQEFTVSVRTLEEMTADLSKAAAHLIVHMLRDFMDEKTLLAALADELSAPWRYKPPQRVGDRPARRDGPPKRKRRPRSSPA